MFDLYLRECIYDIHSELLRLFDIIIEQKIMKNWKMYYSKVVRFYL